MLIRQPAAPWCRPEAGVRRAHCRGSAGPLRALGGPHRVRCAARAGDEEAAISEGDMASKLAKAEEEAAKLREELDRVRTQEAQAAASAPAAKESRIDGRSYRETGGIVMGRKKGGDLEFGAGLTEADVFRGQDESEIIDAQKVRRNLLVGAGVTVGTALLSTVRFRLPSSKPLYTYLVPVLTAQDILKNMEASAEEGDFFSVKQQLKSILGPPNSLKDNLIGAAAALPSMKETDNAITVAFDLMEYVEQIDYNKYFESRLSTLGTPSGEQNAEFSTFVGKCIKASEDKLDYFLSLMPVDQVQAARAAIE